jgi:hypothetical protein
MRPSWIYYEQLMYVGDSRLEALITYVISTDERLPRKAVRSLDCHVCQTATQALSSRHTTIPPFRFGGLVWS